MRPTTQQQDQRFRDFCIRQAGPDEGQKLYQQGRLLRTLIWLPVIILTMTCCLSTAWGVISHQPLAQILYWGWK